jgi:hypothetical protein
MAATLGLVAVVALTRRTVETAELSVAAVSLEV